MMKIRTWAWMGLAGVLTLGLAGCGSTAAAAHKGKAVVAASRIKPSTIYATPKSTLGLSAPLPNGQLWLVAGTAATKGIYLLDLPTHKMPTSLSVSNAASAIAEASTGVIGLGMATPTSGAIEFLNGSTGAAIRTVALSGPVESVAAGDDGVTFYALNGTATARAVAVVDSQTGKITATVPAPKDGVAVAASPNQQSLYILEPNGNVNEVAVPSGQLESLFTIGHSGYAMVLAPDGDTLYVLKGQGTARNVAVVDVNTERVLKVLPSPADANGVSLSPDGNTLYISTGTQTFGNIQAYRVG